MIKVTDWLLINVTILATCSGIKASEIAPVESTSSQAKQFIDNIFDYTLAQIDAPKGIKLVNKTVDHPVFGKMYVISHKDDIDYYDRNVTDKTCRETLVNNFLYYVAEISSREIEPKELKEALLKMTGTKVGMNTLKVITAKYMQVYNKYKAFYDKNNVILNACIDAEDQIESLKYKQIPEYSDLLDRKRLKIVELDKNITSGKTQLYISHWDNPLLGIRTSEYQAAYEKFKKYHKLQKNLQKLKTKHGAENSESRINEEKQIIEKIMSYDDYTRASYKISRSNSMKFTLKISMIYTSMQN